MGQTHQRRAAGGSRDGGGRRDPFSGDQKDGGLHRSNGHSPASPLEQAPGAGVVGMDAGDELGGYRSSGLVELEATELN